MPAGLSAVTINNEHEPPCVCGTAEGLSLRTGCAREVGSLLLLHMSNFHSVVFFHTWCSERLWRERGGGERGRGRDGLTQGFNLDAGRFFFRFLHCLVSSRNAACDRRTPSHGDGHAVVVSALGGGS